MKIGELARRSGLTASRIRFYEASGLINAQRLGNGYRDYPEQALHTLEIITCGQQAGFSLEEMRNLMPDPTLRAGHHDRLLESLQRKVTEIDAMQQRLAQNRAQLLAIIAGIEGKPEGMGCEENAQRMLAGWRERGGAGANGVDPTLDRATKPAR
ncbi:MerR family transcriptional regulator [Pseudomonas sp. TCU-HL1]|uniref:MerR family transcriptional regulator n=1 Tax=Pseudomonas sp. TCU-HL1 TaxID=1856685 RepID=UPI00083DC771|nr:MerR family transcriptional regulator [Pseudomonas sp. TCU-HL1]AOE84844.1 MerR family transcriptional regulator [Pseudomonas sp. TCU-HL1]